jgi:hypothetical protein
MPHRILHSLTLAATGGALFRGQAGFEFFELLFQFPCAADQLG